MNQKTPEDVIRERGRVFPIDQDASGPAPSLVDDAPAKDAKTNGLEIWDAGDDNYEVPPRAWLLGNTFCRRFLSSLVADGGVGKTAVRIAQLIGLATGRNLTGEHVFQRCRVLILSLEDDRDELRRRVSAVLRHYNIKSAELSGWLFLSAPKGLKLAKMVEGAPQSSELETLLKAAIQKYKIDLVSLDPFVKTHSLAENDNNAMDFVAGILAALAIEHNCAVDAPHHTKKGTNAPGDADNGRGASSMKAAARLVHTLTAMSTEEAKGFGIPEAERRSLVRVDNAKVNIAPPSREARWFRLVSVPLMNQTEMYPAGDEVQTVEPWQPPNAWEGLDTSLLNRVLEDIDAGLPNGSRYSDSSHADDRAAWQVVTRHAPEKTEKQAREVIRTWVKNGLLINKDYEDPKQRKTRKGLWVNPPNRPTVLAPLEGI